MGRRVGREDVASSSLSGRGVLQGESLFFAFFPLDLLRRLGEDTVLDVDGCLDGLGASRAAGVSRDVSDGDMARRLRERGVDEKAGGLEGNLALSVGLFDRAGRSGRVGGSGGGRGVDLRFRGIVVRPAMAMVVARDERRRAQGN